jgi:glycosyltransferase involved in cell wall biosynthesis
VRILVYPHYLGIGGSQINAIDLAAGVASAGHDVLIYGEPGPLVPYIRQRGLRFIAAPPMRFRPDPLRIAQLARLAVRERLDLIHAYEWPPCLDAYYGAALMRRVPLVCTVLGMKVMPFVPASVPLIMGTEELGDVASAVQRGRVWVLEPPIDTENDHPGIDGSEFRKKHAVDPADVLIVTVSRLAVDLKLDALVRAVDAADLLSSRARVRLVLVGGGEASEALAQRAAAVNQKWGREVVTLAGAELDPRGAYAAADIVVGMGSSALRALAIGRPVVVQGEDAFSEVFEPATLDLFIRQGFYGLGDGASGAGRLAEQIARLIDDPALRKELGDFGRQIVCSRFSLQRAVGVQLDIYNELVGRRLSLPLSEAVQAGFRVVSLEVQEHDPRRKRRHRELETRLLGAARQGTWPPAAPNRA